MSARAQVASGVDAVNVHDEHARAESPLSAYELQRRANIQRNEEVLRALGLVRPQEGKPRAVKRERAAGAASMEHAVARRLRTSPRLREAEADEQGAAVGSVTQDHRSDDGLRSCVAARATAVHGDGALEERDGWLLVRSGSLPSGYKGVYANRCGWQAKWPRYLGFFSAPVEAALAIARAIGPEQARLAAATEEQRWRTAPSADEVRAVRERAAAEGLELEVSARSSSGFKGVYENRGAYVANAHGRVVARCTWAEEAALEYARHMRSGAA